MAQEDTLMQSIAKEEAALRFCDFTARDALEIGQILIRQAQADDTPILICIQAFGMTLFQYAFDGVTPDNFRWMRRKANITELYRHSSYYMQQVLMVSGKELSACFSLDPMEYDASGGCFPILLRGGGMIGHISVSGYSPSGDHQAVVKAIRHYLQKGA
ncbi:MAG: heme-binding protein [Eubacteriales bacterium]|nr:heme-binding protein [Eubacteriales bacterium]